MVSPKVWWLCWVDQPDGRTIGRSPRVMVWSGTNAKVPPEFARDSWLVSARVEADSEADAWAELDRCLPDASKGHRIHSIEYEPGWMPPADRFPPEAAS